ncbi:MAG TPA: polysaccharide biosynthesis/export family protein [Candidatus Tyrphobacter sp.]
MNALRAFALGALLVPALAFACQGIVPAQVDQSNEAASPFELDGGYHIQGGDQISIAIDDDPTLTQSVTVLDDGTIDLPLIGHLSIGDLSPQQAEREIAHRLAAYMRHPVVVVSIVKEGALEVTVLGDVKLPGKYELRSQGRLLDAIAAAGGVAEVETAQYPDARISTPGGGDVATISLQHLLQDGDTSLDVPLHQGAVVYVPGRMTFAVQVLGAVDHPGALVLHEGDRVSMAIAVAGDSRSANGDLNRISLTRHFPNGTVGSYQVNLYPALLRGDERYDPALKPGDVLFVPEANGRAVGEGIFSSILYVLGSLFHF